MDMNHDGNMPHDHPMTSSNMTMAMHWTHMTFFWGSHSEILFAGWPGARTGMYVLALFAVFAVSAVVEWLNHCDLAGNRGGRGDLAAGLVRTAVHGVRVALMYLLMLAVMSFNVGILIVAIVGHAAGFLIFGAFKRPDSDGVVKPAVGC